MKLEIKIPEYATEFKDWSDHELVTLSFFHYCYQQKGIKPQTEFYVASHDMMRMLNVFGSKKGYENAFEGLRRVFRIGITNSHTVQLSIKPEYLKTINWNGKARSAMVHITKPSAVAIWFFLAGRCTDSYIFEDLEPWQKYNYARDFFWRAPAVI